MALERPLYMQPVSGDPAIQYSAQQDRAGLLGSVFSREGVLDKDAGHLQVTQRAAGANMSVDVAAGRCAIVGDDIPEQGTYSCTSTTPINLTIPARPASGSRVHRVVARVRDKLANGVWTTYDWVIQLLEDTGSGTPSTPNTAISLALITVTSSTTSITTSGNVQDDRKRASVGTPWLVGSILESGFTTNYAGRDTTRPLMWTKNADGWVTLAGFVRRTVGDTPLTARVFYNWSGTTSVGTSQPLLPPEARPTGIRDVAMTTSEGFAHLAIHPAGTMQWRFYSNVGLVGHVDSGSWFSFDSITFRATPFG